MFRGTLKTLVNNGILAKSLRINNREVTLDQNRQKYINRYGREPAPKRNKSVDPKQLYNVLDRSAKVAEYHKNQRHQELLKRKPRRTTNTTDIWFSPSEQIAERDRIDSERKMKEEIQRRRANRNKNYPKEKSQGYEITHEAYSRRQNEWEAGHRRKRYSRF